MASAASESETGAPHKLIVNYIPSTVTQENLATIFGKVGELVTCKLVMNNQTGESQGYGFIEYTDKEHADHAIRQINGIKMLNKTLKVSYARDDPDDSNLYVAGLPPSIDEKGLRELFGTYGDILMTKILYHPDQTSRGAGFVRFTTRAAANKAIEDLVGAKIEGWNVPLTVKFAIPAAKAHEYKMSLKANRFNPIGSKESTGTSAIPVVNQLQSLQSTVAGAGTSGGTTVDGVPVISVYVYGLQLQHGELDLYELFSPFGAIKGVKMMRDMSKEGYPSKGFGFVNFLKYEDATSAIATMNGKEYDKKTLQVAFKTAKGTQQIIDPNILANITVTGQPQQVATGLPMAGQQLQLQQQLAALQAQTLQLAGGAGALQLAQPLQIGAGGVPFQLGAGAFQIAANGTPLQLAPGGTLQLAPQQIQSLTAAAPHQTGGQQLAAATRQQYIKSEY